MSDQFNSLEEATAALAATAERAALLIRTESTKAREDAMRTRAEIEEVRGEIRATKDDAARTRQEIEGARGEIRATRAEIEVIRANVESGLNDTQRVRRSAGWAWSAVAVMAGCSVLAVGYTASKVTRSSVALAGLGGEVRELKQVVTLKDGEITNLRGEVQFSKMAQARAEGELAALASFSKERTVSLPAETPRCETPKCETPKQDTPVAVEPAVTGFEQLFGEIEGDIEIGNEPLAAPPTTRPAHVVDLWTSVLEAALGK